MMVIWVYTALQHKILLPGFHLYTSLNYFEEFEQKGTLCSERRRKSKPSHSEGKGVLSPTPERYEGRLHVQAVADTKKEQS